MNKEVIFRANADTTEACRVLTKFCIHQILSDLIILSLNLNGKFIWVALNYKQISESHAEKKH